MLIGWLYLFARPEFTPVLPKEEGCYKGSGLFSDLRLVITSKGSMNFDAQSVPISLTRDKLGYSFYPTEKVMISKDKHAIVTTAGEPALLRIDEDGSFNIPLDDGNVVVFSYC